MEPHFIFPLSLIIGFMLETNDFQIKDYIVVTFRKGNLFGFQKMKKKEKEVEEQEKERENASSRRAFCTRTSRSLVVSTGRSQRLLEGTWQ